MKRIIRLTESDLTRIIKRVINEKVETTAMTPIVTKEIPVTGGKGLSVSTGEKTKEGGTIYYDITVKGNNTIDPSKGGERSKDFVEVTFFVASNFYTSLTYDCVNGKVLRTGGKVSGQLSPGARVELLGKREGNSRTVETFSSNGQAMYNLTNRFLTTSGPAAQVIQHYCSTK
jgi:hypothetical protein